jgi:cellulose biosynthesis protein BcsQ
MLTPLPPATVDFHSSLKFVASLPALIDSIEMDGHTCNLIGNVGFMSKILNKSDHKICHSQAKEVFGADMLDMVLPRLDGFERCGETFDTVISANPATYDGSTEALKAQNQQRKTLRRQSLIASSSFVLTEVCDVE